MQDAIMKDKNIMFKIYKIHSNSMISYLTTKDIILQSLKTIEKFLN